MYLVKCGYCGSTYESETESNLKCENCGAINNVEDIIRKTSGNYFKQAAQQDYNDVKKVAGRKPKTELEKVNIMQKDKKIALLFELCLGVLALLVLAIVAVIV